MTLDEYQTLAHETAVYPPNHDIPYLALGIGGEAGEVCDTVKKVLRRDGKFDVDDKHAIAMEVGDVLWYVSEISRKLGYSLQELADLNLAKLHERRLAGTLKTRTTEATPCHSN